MQSIGNIKHSEMFNEAKKLQQKLCQNSTFVKVLDNLQDLDFIAGECGKKQREMNFKKQI